MDNCSNCRVNTNVAGPGFEAILVLILLVVVTAIVVDIILITALCVAHFMSK